VDAGWCCASTHNQPTSARCGRVVFCIDTRTQVCVGEAHSCLIVCPQICPLSSLFTPCCTAYTCLLTPLIWPPPPPPLPPPYAPPPFQVDFAMESLQKAMKWDEDVYGLEYDLVSERVGHRACVAHTDPGHLCGCIPLCSVDERGLVSRLPFTVQCCHSPPFGTIIPNNHGHPPSQLPSLLLVGHISGCK
jgi:hypothetical protein